MSTRYNILWKKVYVFDNSTVFMGNDNINLTWFIFSVNNIYNTTYLASHNSYLKLEDIMLHKKIWPQVIGSGD